MTGEDYLRIIDKIIDWGERHYAIIAIVGVAIVMIVGIE